jgi:signal transduction histidine kinase
VTTEAYEARVVIVGDHAAFRRSARRLLDLGEFDVVSILVALGLVVWSRRQRNAQADLLAQLGKVRKSRARILAAADEERRRIERDLHDGAPQRLVALALELRTAQERLGHGEDRAVDDLLADAVAELLGAVTDLRELARGIHPATLTEGGLTAALESLAARSPVPVQLNASLNGRPPVSVEATAYFVASEALANVARHAQAHAATVAARHANGTLVIEVDDDGVGGAHLDGGSGLRGLVDRVEAQGGSLSIESPDRGGTRIVGEVPCAP